MHNLDRSRIALGLITREINDPIPIYRFLDNTETYGHSIERVIIAYSHAMDECVLDELRSRVPLDVLCVHKAPALAKRLEAQGLDSDQVEGLIGEPEWPLCHEIPYGTYRNVVLLQAILEGMEYLIFFDTDVEPRVLTAIDDGQPAWEPIDFVGTHIASLHRADVSATTSEYSGYYIIPPMAFEGFTDLLFGLGKGMALEYMENCQEHQCLNLGPRRPTRPRLTSKPLGGNLGLSLDKLWRLAPFFSTLYPYKNTCVKGRGEDTLLGQALHEADGKIMDVDLRVFHDTYVDFPYVPDISRPIVRDRFYRACLGWIGRNPFMTWFMDRIGRLQSSFEAEINVQRIGLAVGGEAAAVNLGDDRFRDLPTAFEASYARLPQAIDRFRNLINGWNALTESLGRGRPPVEERARLERWLPLAS